jgi:pimeloyl-ACP methyl ester carboxylesterase
VSWYEAAAYCESVGKILPTVFHWNRASGSALAARIVPASNLNGPALARVGEFPAVGPFGTYDMAGNAREWVWNASGQRRYILGGAWDDRPATFREPDLRSPFERASNFGFRCMRPLAPGALSPAVLGEIVPPSVKIEAPTVPDPEYAVIERLYSYDRTPLNPTVERRDSSPEDWIEEKVSVDAAYGDERLVLHVFLPKRRAPPFPSVVYFPGSGAMHALFSDQISTAEFDFVVRSGRALCFPIYKGTYQRGIGRQDDNPDDSSGYRDLMIMLSKDLGRAIDYLESRPEEFDTESIAYLGYSWGAALGAIFPALEPRLRVAVLDGGGYFQQMALPEADQRTFAPRVRIPVLMVNGRHDSAFPVDTAQTPMFEDLGTAKKDKLHRIEPSGHTVPRPTRIRATLDWLDRYQGEAQ